MLKRVKLLCRWRRHILSNLGMHLLVLVLQPKKTIKSTHRRKPSNTANRNSFSDLSYSCYFIICHTQKKPNTLIHNFSFHVIMVLFYMYKANIFILRMQANEFVLDLKHKVPWAPQSGFKRPPSQYKFTKIYFPWGSAEYHANWPPAFFLSEFEEARNVPVTRDCVRLNFLTHMCLHTHTHTRIHKHLSTLRKFIITFYQKHFLYIDYIVP